MSADTSSAHAPAAQDPAASTAPAAYSPTQIVLHWVVAALVVFQIVFAEAMEELGEAAEYGERIGAGEALLGNLHIWAGFAILALTVWRLVLKATHGAPPEPKGTPATLFLMRATYALFYLLLIAVPLTGAAAWYLGIEAAGEVHELSKPAFIALIALHVAATIWHGVVLKDQVMARMLPARRGGHAA